MLIKGTVCGCSNGFLWCSDRRYTTALGYYLYEPLSRGSILLRSPPGARRKHCLYAVGFVCDPCSYNHANDETRVTTTLNPDHKFRVVLIQSFIARLPDFQVEIFSSETGKWRQLVVNCPNWFAFAPHCFLGIAHEGRLYFMGGDSILVYDPYGNLGYTIDYPADTDPMNIISFACLGSSCGSLRIADIGHDVVSVWELLDDDNHWHLLHRTDFSTNLPSKFCANHYKRVGAFHPHDGDIVYLASYAEGIFVGNLRTNEFERFLVMIKMISVRFS